MPAAALRLRAAACLLAGLALSLAAPAGARTAEEIFECVKANQPELSVQQEITLKIVDRLGADRTLEAELFWQRFGEGSKALIRFGAPANLRGSALLMLEKGDRSDMFMYLPELQKVRRVNNRSVAGAMFGTDFSYEDFERYQGLSADGDTKRLDDGEVEGRAVYVVEARPARGDTSAYERVVSHVDQERCVPLRTELYEDGGRLRKVMEMPSEKLSQEAKSWVPRLVVMRDLLDETHTELVVEKVTLDEKLPRRLFSERALISRR